MGKKYKGHTIIELKDVHTGEVERYEDDNMFTNAIEKIVNFAMTHAYQSNGLVNMYTDHLTLLQGLMLLDTQVLGDADTIWMPAGVRPTGYARVGYSNARASAKQLGSYNASESDVSQNLSKKYVFDFATDQANGTIACVCLTHINAGLYGYGGEEANFSHVTTGVPKQIGLCNILTQSEKGRQDTYSTVTPYGTVGGSYIDFAIDAENDLKYQMKVTSTGLTILSHKMSPEKFDVFRGVASVQPATEDTYSQAFSGERYYHFYNSHEKVLYFWLGNFSTSDVYYSNGTSFTIYKFDMTSKTLSTHGTYTNNTGTTVHRNLAVTNSAVYEIDFSNSQSRIWKYAFTGGATTQLTTNAGNSSGTNLFEAYCLNGIIYFPMQLNHNSYGGYKDTLIDTTTDKVYYSPCRTNAYISGTGENGRFSIIPPYDDTQVGFYSNFNENVHISNINNLEGNVNGIDASYGNTGVNAFTMCNYLGTINNLSSPVTKTADKTMKITYIISEEQEES